MKEKLIALGLAASLTCTLTSCGKKEKEFIYPNFETSLNNISSFGETDDFLRDETFHELTKTDLTSILTMHHIARNSGEFNFKNLNKSIENLGLVTLKAKVMDTLAIHPNDINNIEIIYSNNLICKITKKDKETFEYYLRGNAKEIVNIVINAQANTMHTIEDIDNAYNKITGFLYTDSIIEGKKIIYSTSPQKMKTLKK